MGCSDLFYHNEILVPKSDLSYHNHILVPQRAMIPREINTVIALPRHFFQSCMKDLCVCNFEKGTPSPVLGSMAGTLIWMPRRVRTVRCAVSSHPGVHTIYAHTKSC